MKTIRLQLAFVLLFAFQFCFSQSHPDSIRYFKSYFTNSCDLMVAPFYWKNQDIERAVIGLGATGFLMIYDEHIARFMSVNQHEKAADISEKIIVPFGNGMYSLPLLGFIYLNGVIGNNNYDKEIALLGLKTFIIASGGATVSKWAFQRQRPPASTSGDSWAFEGPFGDLNDEGSFVSRHATTAFSLAAVLSDGYKEKHKWVPYIAYGLASAVTVSRVYNRKHWASDAFAGACLGVVTGKFLFLINQRKFGSIYKRSIK